MTNIRSYTFNPPCAFKGTALLDEYLNGTKSFLRRQWHDSSQNVPPRFVEPEDSSPFSQEPAKIS